jgi:hypothetical protein
MQEILERLVAANIQLLPLTQIQRHWVLERDGFVSLVERTADGGFGKIGAPGLLTERGMAVLMNGVFVAKGLELPASGEQVESMRSFARDLEAALQP